MRAGRARYYRRHGGRTSEIAYRAIVRGADTAKGALARIRGS